MKICTKCKEELPATVEYFYKDKRRKDGLRCWCKECVKEYQKENREQILEYQKERYQENREQILKKNKENSKEYREKNREQILKKRKERYEQHPEYDKEYGKEYREQHPEYAKKYRQKPALYNTYALQLEWCEKVRRNEENTNLLEITCTKCKTWFIPTNMQVQSRILAINGNTSGKSTGEMRFYCSDNCKNVCEIFGRKPETLMKDDAIKAGRIPWNHLNREVQPELREMVLERDDYTCQKCGSTDNLKCHHMIPVAYDPIESVDIDVCITLCEKCHKEAHQLPGCTIGDIRKNSVLQECYG